LQRESFIYIPNSLHGILHDFSGEKIETVYKSIPNSDHEILDSYFNLLIKNELIIISNSKNFLKNFPNISNNKSSPFRLTNAVFYKHNLNKKLYSSLMLLTQFGCFYFQIHVSDRFSESMVLRFISNINVLPIKQIELYFDSNIKPKIKFLKTLQKSTNKFVTLYFYSTEFRKFETIDYEKIKSVCYNKRHPFYSNSSRVSEGTFDVNYLLYYEALKFNTYLYKKIFINDKNEINLHPLYKGNFGTLKEENIKLFLNNKTVNRYWHTRKDTIDICCQCEYKYMCVDSRFPIRTNNRKWKFTEECNYNPTTSKWKLKSLNY
jgi:SPASM domain peptide maturase of grasp-with-spasm system